MQSMIKLFFLLEPWDVRELYIRKTGDLPLQLGTFPCFVAIWILFCIRNPYINRFTNHFALDPIIPPFDFHFEIYKRDLAILTE